MIAKIILEIFLNWILMGVTIAIIMTAFLYFAVICEKIVDAVFSR